jgi:hypothetical protein
LSSKEQKETHRIVRDILRETGNATEQVRLWKERTGKGHSAFYKRKAEVVHPDFGPEASTP